jgi:hypothetical protein
VVVVVVGAGVVLLVLVLVVDNDSGLRCPDEDNSPENAKRTASTQTPTAAQIHAAAREDIDRR